MTYHSDHKNNLKPSNLQFIKKPKNFYTLRSQIEGYTRLLILRKFSILPAVIRKFPVFSPTRMKFFQPAVIRAYPLIKIEEKFLPTLFLESPLVLET